MVWVVVAGAEVVAAVRGVGRVRMSQNLSQSLKVTQSKVSYIAICCTAAIVRICYQALVSEWGRAVLMWCRCVLRMHSVLFGCWHLLHPLTLLPSLCYAAVPSALQMMSTQHQDAPRGRGRTRARCASVLWSLLLSCAAAYRYCRHCTAMLLGVLARVPCDYTNFDRFERVTDSSWCVLFLPTEEGRLCV